MKAPAVVFAEPKRIEIREMAYPEVGAGQLSIRTVFSAGCDPIGATPRYGRPHLLASRRRHARRDLRSRASCLTAHRRLPASRSGQPD
jgi:hypothetical protein